MSNKVDIFHTLPWLLIVIAVGALTLVAIAIESDSNWDCTPINPGVESIPAQPCFRASLSAENLVTLQWRVTESAPFVYIYDDFGAVYEDIGIRPASCKSHTGKACSATVRVAEGGYFRWLLMVENTEGDRIHVPVAISVPGPLPIKEVSGGGIVDVLAPTARRFSWLVDARNSALNTDLERAWIELKAPGSFVWQTDHYSRVGLNAGFTAPQAVFNKVGAFSYLIRDCHLPAGSSTKFCSPPTSVGFYVGSDHFTGHRVKYVSSGEDLELQFTTSSGNIRLLSSPTLIPKQGGMGLVGTTDSSYLVDGARLTPGMHKVELVSCHWHSKECANRKNADRANKPGTLQREASGYHDQGDLIATVTPDDGSLPQLIVAPATGDVYFDDVSAQPHIDTGDLIAYVITQPSDQLYVLVDSPVEWELERDYSYDFDPAVTHTVTGGGQPLDISYDSSGGIWLLNEFSNNIEHVTRDGQVESITVPLARNLESPPPVFPPVRPFALQLEGNTTRAVAISSLAERVTRIGSKMWFTQGGGLLGRSPGDVGNHSRIISYNPSLSDSPATVYDDRMCVYNVPFDDANGVGDNQVIGLTASNNRIWIGESRGFLNTQPSSVSAFVDNPDQCQNLLNFDDPTALSTQDLQYCGAGRSPEQDGCMERNLLDALPPGIKVAHLETDPVDQSIWFTDAHGKYLGNLLPHKNNAVVVYRFPDTHDKPQDGIVGFGGFPWTLKIDESAVYLGEYATQHILRFDKASSTFDEIHIPCTTSQVTLHSIEIDRTTDRLWFTLSNELPVPLDKKASKIGYINLTEWRDHIAEPQRKNSISAVIYSGLDTIPASKDRPNRHQAFRGIAIEPSSGKIALATMWRNQITELTPNAGFWP